MWEINQMKQDVQMQISHQLGRIDEIVRSVLKVLEIEGRETIKMPCSPDIH